MATGSFTIGVTLSPTNRDMYGSESISSSVSYTSGSIPSGATITGGSMTFSSIAVYSTREPYWRIQNESSGVVYAESEAMYQQSAGSLTLS